jgi:hypothetical protein
MMVNFASTDCKQGCLHLRADGKGDAQHFSATKTNQQYLHYMNPKTVAKLSQK